MILLDASVLIDFSRTKGRDPKLSGLLTSLPVRVCGLTRTEVLAGARDAAERSRLVRLLDGFVQLPTDESVWDPVGDNLAALCRSGLTVPFQDVVLVTIAIQAGIELWARDHHFPAMQRVLRALRLFVEPP